MRSYSTAITNHLNSGKPYQEHLFLTFKVKNKSTNAEVQYHFTTKEANITASVVDQDSFATVSRDYFGGGSIVGYDPLIRSPGTGIRMQRVVLSALHPKTIDMVQACNCFNASFEWHVGIVDTNTNLLVDDQPFVEFVGFVNQITPSYGAVDPDTMQGTDAVYEVEIANLMRGLTMTNPAVRSHEEGLLQSNDPVYRWTDSANIWRPLWGKEKKNHDRKK